MNSGCSATRYMAHLCRARALCRAPAQKSRLLGRCNSTRSRPPPPISFAFDIDGVLLKSSKPIPGAPESLALLQKHDIPFILLTNGGGSSEADRVKNLTRHLGVAISESQFIQSHTPFQSHPACYGYKNVLVCGGVLDACRNVAKGYGFPHVTIPFDILAGDASIWPYHTLTDEELRVTVPLSKDPIDAIYVFHDPRDWGLDSQIILDLLLSRNGVVGSRVKKVVGHEQSVPLYFSNPDLVWANAYPHTRFGQGAFQILLEGLYRAMTDRPLKSETIGKPSGTTYEYAAQVLRDHRLDINERVSGGRGPEPRGAQHGGDGERETVYMVGDNKLSDIKGANQFGWESILVQTGVFDGSEEEGTSGEVPAKYCVGNVADAVAMVLEKHKVILKGPS